jgi:hypothetical protein
MQVRFWGTRGSIPKCGPQILRYGGSTPCIEVLTEAGTLIVIDCGSGGHGLGQSLQGAGRGGRGHLLISHTGVVMSGRRPLIKGFFRRCADRGCGHVFGLSRGEFDPLALMLSADPLPPSRERA